MIIDNSMSFEFEAFFGDQRVIVRLSQISGKGNPWSFEVSFVTQKHQGHISMRRPGEWIGPNWFSQEDLDALGERIEEYFKGKLK